MVPITSRIRWAEIVVNSIVASASSNQTTQSMVVESEMADRYDGFDLVGDRNCQIVNDKELDDASRTPTLLACLPKAADQMLESWALGASWIHDGGCDGLTPPAWDKQLPSLIPRSEASNATQNG
ncbi:hypothetical protein MGU_03659 [Metarhizium guizhouense ARSEF 977]|uniref:Uncharacterized protein n=1 Tax=Metarhizium guizhouense (strain ARSEF 977) TaxID=1276136 RepID=A0A0B4HBX4_METGA|nr:hypothetical protein MGU_03659 [Metarhizium guizhouense ARSEF 977]